MTATAGERQTPAPVGAPLAAWSEATLVARAQGGDPAAFEVLLLRHQHRLFGLAVRVLGSRSDAQDAVQEAFLVAWQQVGGFRQDASFATWLSRIVYRRCLNLVRGRQEAVWLAEPDLLSGGGDSPEAVVEHSEMLTALRAALGTLTEEQRVCWVLREMGGHSYEEVTGGIISVELRLSLDGVTAGLSCVEQVQSAVAARIGFLLDEPVVVSVVVCA